MSPIFDGDNIKNGKGKKKSHPGIAWSSSLLHYGKQVPRGHGALPHGSGFLDLRKANQNRDEKHPRHLLLPACEKSTKINQAQNLWLFSTPRHEIVLSLHRNCMG